MIRNYETVFILNPVLSDEQIKEAVKKYKKFILDKGAEIIHERDWGMQKLAYKIQHKTTGYYYLIEFNSEGSVIADLEVEYKRDEKMLRFLTVALDKHAYAYNLKKRTKVAEALNDAKEKPEEVKLTKPNENEGNN